MPEVRNTPTTLPANAVWWFFAIAFVVLFAGYGLRDPWPADEPRFVLVAKQMVESGNWLFPHRGIELYPEHGQVAHDRRAHRRGVLADAAGEDDGDHGVAGGFELADHVAAIGGGINE